MAARNNISLVITEDQCTGCSACRNICPVSAISMAENDDGFIMPQVDDSVCVYCGKCQQVCPALHPETSNNISPPCFSFRAADDIRLQSSSGGLFSVLADQVLQAGGYVCGAAFDEKWRLRHVASNSLDMVKAMRGSKYVQSDMGLVYREIEKLLKDDKPVLFTGTPCQVAGLASFLGRHYANLLMVDILCHGVPSQRIFQYELMEAAKGRKISGINFRNKKFGWTSIILEINFANGEFYLGKLTKMKIDRVATLDPYERGFHHKLFLRKSCADCPFCAFPRRGDLSMGDFWGYDKIFSKSLDSKGTSIVFANTPKGEKIIKKLKERDFFIQDVVDYSGLPNRLQAKNPPNSARNRFFDLIKYKDFSTAVNYSLDSRYDIGCVGIYTVPNFGGAITYFALYKILKHLGYSTLMIERPWSSSHKPDKVEAIFEKNPYFQADLAPIYENRKEMEILNSFTDTFVVGSDQLFNALLYDNFDRFVNLDWVHDNKKKIAYAASFGHDFIWHKEEAKAELGYYLKKYDAFSVREKSGVNICADNFGIQATHVLDPVFLCPIKYYQELAAATKEQNNPTDNFLFAYILDPSSEKENVIVEIASKLNVQTRIYTEFGLDKKFKLPVQGGNFNKQMLDLMESQYVITDSFHGACFAIIFKKDFIAFANPLRGTERFKSILSMCNLENRLIFSKNDWDGTKEILLNKIDYDIVYKNLEPFMQKCQAWLVNNIEKKILKTFSDHDIFCDRLKKSEEINKNLLANFYKKIEFLASLVANSFIIIDDINTYLEALYNHREDIIICMTVKDTPGMAIDEKLAKRIMRLGTKISLENKHWKGYVALIDGGKLLLEQISKENETININVTIDKMILSLSSSPYITDNLCNIEIDGDNKAVGGRGLNIVVLDKKTHDILDSISFDTHLPSFIPKRVGYL